MMDKNVALVVALVIGGIVAAQAPLNSQLAPLHRRPAGDDDRARHLASSPLALLTADRGPGRRLRATSGNAPLPC